MLKTVVMIAVLTVTLTSTYDEANKVDKIPPENKMKIIYDNKVVGCKLTTFNNI